VGYSRGSSAGAFADPGNFAPLDKAIAEIQQFDRIILTSGASGSRGGEAQRVSEAYLIYPGSKLRIASVGPVTAEAARQAGLAVEYVAETHSGAALAEELKDQLRDEGFLATERSSIGLCRGR